MKDIEIERIDCITLGKYIIAFDTLQNKIKIFFSQHDVEEKKTEITLFVMYKLTHLHVRLRTGIYFCAFEGTLMVFQ